MKLSTRLFLFQTVFITVLHSSESIKFNLVTTYFDRHDRIHEFHQCFQENIRNKYIKKIYVLYEDFRGHAPWFLLDEKIVIVPLDHYPIHKDFYDFINKKLPNELVILANTDIFFDESLKSLRHINFDNHIAILTRYNVEKYTGKWKRHPNSHDAWIFKSPVKYKNGNYKINLFCNENIMLNEWIKCGYTVTNPSLTVKAWHVHLSDHRNQAVLKGYCNRTDLWKEYNIPFSTLPD